MKLGHWYVIRSISLITKPCVPSKALCSIQITLLTCWREDLWPFYQEKTIVKWHIDGLVQDCGNSIAKALELLQSCTKPSIYSHRFLCDVITDLHSNGGLAKVMISLSNCTNVAVISHPFPGFNISLTNLCYLIRPSTRKIILLMFVRGQIKRQTYCQCRLAQCFALSGILLKHICWNLFYSIQSSIQNFQIRSREIMNKCHTLICYFSKCAWLRPIIGNHSSRMSWYLQNIGDTYRIPFKHIVR